MTTIPALSNKISAVPGQTDPYHLVFQYQEYLLKSWALYIQKVGESFHLDLDELIEKCATIDPSKRFSPGLYVYYDQLKEGYRQKNLHEIFDALQAFKTLTHSDLYLEKMRFTSILSDNWERLCLPQMRSAHQNERGESVQMLPLIHWKEESFPPDSLSVALDWIREIDPSIFREMEAYVKDVKLFAGKILESSTSARFFGALFLRIPYPDENPSFFYFRNLVHELSHLHLYALAKEDPIVLNEESELFTSPLRVDKRPMIGVFHAVFVLARIVRIFRKYLMHFSSQDPTAEEMLKTNQEAFLKGHETIARHGCLTKRGKDVFDTLEECAYS
ncbi:MAG: hypothetical protein JJU12_00885 [Chlamydiales bacterium]|nr:hypothetical protein [Chlamydiales bacterium]